MPISKGLRLTMSLACSGSHEGSCLANLEQFSLRTLAARLGVGTFSCAMGSSQMIWFRSPSKCFRKINVVEARL